MFETNKNYDFLFFMNEDTMHDLMNKHKLFLTALRKAVHCAIFICVFIFNRLVKMFLCPTVVRSDLCEAEIFFFMPGLTLTIRWTE